MHNLNLVSTLLFKITSNVAVGVSSCARQALAETRMILVCLRFPIPPNNGRDGRVLFTNRREVKDPGRPSCYSHRGRVTFWGVFNIANEGFRLWRTEWIRPEMRLKVESAAMWLRSGRSVWIFLLEIGVRSFILLRAKLKREEGTFDHDRCGLGVSHCPALAQEPYPYFLVDGTRLYGRRKCPVNPWSYCGIMLNARYEYFHRRRAEISFRLKVIRCGFILTSLPTGVLSLDQNWEEYLEWALSKFGKSH